LPVPGREAVGAVCPEMDSWTEMGRSSAFAFSIVIGRARRNAPPRVGAMLPKGVMKRGSMRELGSAMISQKNQTG
jgi:hypothetical protein